jgi:hypothetical protein
VAPIIIGIIVHFRFHIRCISIHKLLLLLNTLKMELRQIGFRLRAGSGVEPSGYSVKVRQLSLLSSSNFCCYVGNQGRLLNTCTTVVTLQANRNKVSELYRHSIHASLRSIYSVHRFTAWSKTASLRDQQMKGQPRNA